MTERETGETPGAGPQDAQPQDAQPQDAQPQDAQPQDAQPPDAQPPGEAATIHGRLARELRAEAGRGGAEGARAATTLGHATEALHLEIVATRLRGERVLVGHVLGLRLLLHAGDLHGPRETPALAYLFADALAVRPTDDAPMSTVPLYGLHMVLPPLAVARWLYKAGRITHANVDLVEDAQHFEASLAGWTVDDFAEADDKLQVYRATEMDGRLHVYQHLGFTNIQVAVPGARAVRLKSTLPTSSEDFARLEELFAAVTWPHGLSTAEPTGAPGE